jgi:hypothetical protein
MHKYPGMFLGGIKRSRCEADHSHPSSTEVNNEFSKHGAKLNTETTLPYKSPFKLFFFFMALLISVKYFSENEIRTACFTVSSFSWQILRLSQAYNLRTHSLFFHAFPCLMMLKFHLFLSALCVCVCVCVCWIELWEIRSLKTD